MTIPLDLKELQPLGNCSAMINLKPSRCHWFGEMPADDNCSLYDAGRLKGVKARVQSKAI